MLTLLPHRPKAIPWSEGAKSEPVPFTPKATVEHIAPISELAMRVMAASRVITKGPNQ